MDTAAEFSMDLSSRVSLTKSNPYYRDGRDVSSSLSKLAMQIGVDAVGNVLKEFWPDLRRKFSKRSQNYAKTMEKSAQ